MKQKQDLQHDLHRVFLTSLLVFMGLASPSVTTAQTYRDFELNNAIDLLGSPSPGENGTRFTAPVNSSPTGPATGAGNTLFWFNEPPGNIVWNSGDFNSTAFQYLSFQSADSNVRNVFMSATSNGDFTDIYSPTLGIEHLHLESVNIDPSTVQLAFEGTTSFSWTMSNSRYATSTRTPTFKAIAPLEMSAVAGANSLAFWNGEIGSPTKLVVDPGATLIFERVGDIGMPDEIDRQLFFSQSNANTVDVNGGTLQLDFSGVVFEAAADATVSGGEVTGGFVIRNGGTLDLQGSDGSDSSTRLELRGGMLVDNSTVSLGAKTTIEFNAVGENETVVFNNATVNLGADARFKSELATFVGNNTVTTAAPALSTGMEGFRSAINLQDADTVLTVSGDGNFYAENLIDLNGGTLNLDMADFTQLVSTGPIIGAGTINVASKNQLVINGDFDQRVYGTNLVNEGIIFVEEFGRLNGTGVIAEAGGAVNVRSGGVLDGNTLPSGLANLSMDTLELDFGSQLFVGIDPTAMQASTLNIDQLILDRPASSLAPILNIGLVDDTTLLAGEKLVLIDYSTISSRSGLLPEFLDLPDGHIFQLGLNSYKILYSDSVFGASNGGNSSVITLTAVPEPTVAFPLFLVTVGLFGSRRRRV